MVGSRPEYRHSILEQGCPLSATCDSISTSDPQFISTPHFTQAPSLGGNMKLRYDSPAINAGSNGHVVLDPIDIDGDGDMMEYGPDRDLLNRVQYGQVDLGSFENQDGRCPETPTITSDYNPLYGTFSAQNTIELAGNISIADTLVQFSSPVVRIRASSTVELIGNVSIDANGCSQGE